MPHAGSVDPHRGKRQVGQERNMLPGFTAKSREVRARRREASVAPAPAPTWISDEKNGTLITALMCLLVVRIIVPGFFDYTTSETELIAGSGLVDLLTNQLVWLALLVVPLFLLRSRWALTLRLVGSVNRVMLILLFYTVISITWSIDSGATFRRSTHLVIFLAVSLAACLIAWHPRRFQETLRPVITLMLIASLIFGIVRPDLATTDPNYLLGEHERHWRGLTVHKNEFGALASFGVLLWFHGWLSKEVRRAPALFGVAVSALCLVLSGSSTSVLCTVFTIGFLLITQIAPPQSLRRYMPVLVVLFVTVIVCYALAVLKIVPGLDVLITSITSATGKDPTFTGRTPIWELVKAHIALSPALGSGYGAYWTGDIPGTASSIIKQKLYFYPDEAHEGYLDIINDLGYVGFALLVGFCATYLARSLKLLKIDRTQAVLYMGLLFYELLHNLSESTWMNISVNSLLLIFAAVAMSREMLDQQLQAQFGSVLRRGRRERR
jgi:exopolysaccharide production protein ExoQ